MMRVTTLTTVTSESALSMAPTATSVTAVTEPVEVVEGVEGIEGTAIKIKHNAVFDVYFQILLRKFKLYRNIPINSF